MAGGVTLGLVIAMQSVAAAEFVPQDSNRVRSMSAAHIYQQSIVCWGVDTCWDWAQSVEPPPAIARLPLKYESSSRIIITDQPLSIEDVKVDAGPKPMVRIPPVIPSRFLQGNHSGYCRVRFDVSPQGKPYNVVATLGTNSQLERPTIRSVQKWKYAPKIQNSRAVMRSGVEGIVRFDLLDENGKLLPLPEGY